MTEREDAAFGANKVRYLGYLLAGTMLASLAAMPAQAQQTEAGTSIVNKATATYGASATEVESNEVTLLVDEVLDVTVTWDDTAPVAVEPGATGQMLTFTVTNAGNGSEAFELTAQDGAGDDINPTVTSIVIDDGDDVYEALQDTVYTGTNYPVIGSEDSVKIYIFSTIPEEAVDGNQGRIDLLAEARTGTGVAGTVFAGQGTGSGDAVTGTSGADAEDDGYYIVDADAPPPPPDPLDVDLAKEANVNNDDDLIVPGTTITYTLTATVSGDGTATNLVVTDPIPTGTTYVTSTLTLDGDPLTDAADTDAGSASAAGIEVDLGDVASPGSHVVTFQVTIDE